MKLYEYLEENYEINEPIFLYDVDVEGMSKNAVKLEMKKLQEKEKVIKYDRGIYYMPRETEFGKSLISISDVIEKKYLKDRNNGVIGYLTDINFTNSMRLTTQTAAGYMIRTNKATKNIEEKKIGNFWITIKKPRATITEYNYKYLQLLDMIYSANYFVEDEFEDVFIDRIKEYMKKNNMNMDIMKLYYEYYPADLYKKMYERGLLRETIK